MAPSALLGNDPLSADDAAIKKAIPALKGSAYFPDPKLPYGTRMPYPNAPDEYHSDMLAYTVVFLILIILFTAGRFVIRWKNRVGLGVDDYMILPAAFACIAYLALMLNTTVTGCYGHHIYYCTYSQFEQFFEAIQVAQTVFYVEIYSAKISLLFLNRRITAFTTGWWRKAHWVLLAILIIAFGFSFFGTLFTCRPVSPHYSLLSLAKTDRTKLHCMDPETSDKIQVASRAFHISTDILLLGLPVAIISRLQMSLRKRLSIIFLFCFGTVCVLGSIMRIVVYKHPTSDFMFDSSVLVFWDFLDASFAVIVANMPVYYTVVDAVVIRSRRLLGLHSSKKRSDQSKESSTPSAGTYKDQKPYLPDYDQRTEGHKTPVSILKNARSDVESGRSQSKFADGDSDDIELLEVTDKDLRSNSSRRGFR